MVPGDKATEEKGRADERTGPLRAWLFSPVGLACWLVGWLAGQFVSPVVFDRRNKGRARFRVGKGRARLGNVRQAKQINRAHP